jgi:uncharacterized protein (DUF488 family)
MHVTAERLILTLGTSDRSQEDFCDLLRYHRVALVVDVRRFATSRFEQFRGETIAALLKKVGIAYLPMGDELGGYRRGGYQAFVGSDTFREGLTKLEGIASGSRTAILCAGRLPWRCHRRFIAMELEKRGWWVVHIIDRGRDWIPGMSCPQLPLPM